MHRGYIKVWRKIQDSGLMQMPNTLAVFMHILLNATHKDIKVGTKTGVIDLKRGEYISGRKKLAEELEQSEREIRTSISRLCELGIISQKSTNKYSVYVIENYGNYQDKDSDSDQQTTNKRPADDQQTTTKQTHKNKRTKEIYIPNINSDLLNDYMQVRFAKKVGELTKTAFTAIEKEAEKAGITTEDAIRECCARGWAGFKAVWYQNANPSQPKEEPDWKRGML